MFNYYEQIKFCFQHAERCRGFVNEHFDEDIRIQNRNWANEWEGSAKEWFKMAIVDAKLRVKIETKFGKNSQF